MLSREDVGHAAGLRWVPFYLAALATTQALWTRSTNFGGFDEWLMLDLASRGIASFPEANRPLGLLWALPAPLLSWNPLVGFGVLWVVYVSLTAWLLYGVLLRLMPGRRQMALVAASFLIVWAPGDLARLAATERAVFAGFTFAALLSIAILVESWVRGSGVLLGLAVAAALVAARSYEGTLAILAAAPLLLRAAPGPSARRWLWPACWGSAIALAGGLVLWPTLGGAGWAYQGSVLRTERDPIVLGSRLLWQYGYHFLPLVTSSPRELRVAVVPLTVLLMVLGLAGVAWSCPEPAMDRRVWYAGVAGLLFAGLGYAPILLGWSAPSAYRLQFLSGPGAALSLAALATGVASLARHGGRSWILALFAAWIGAVGAGRTVAMQGTWDAEGFYPRQAAMLRALVARVPDVKPGTMIVLLDEGHAWRATFSFHHAAHHLYGGRAAGCVWRAWDALYAVSFVPSGVRFEPLRQIRGPWGEGVRTYPYGDVVVVRFSAAGEVEVSSRWPDPLPSLPEGARYDPAARIVVGALPRPEWSALGTPMSSR